MKTTFKILLSDQIQHILASSVFVLQKTNVVLSEVKSCLLVWEGTGAVTDPLC